MVTGAPAPRAIPVGAKTPPRPLPALLGASGWTPRPFKGISGLLKCHLCCSQEEGSSSAERAPTSHLSLDEGACRRSQLLRGSRGQSPVILLHVGSPNSPLPAWIWATFYSQQEALGRRESLGVATAKPLRVLRHVCGWGGAGENG